MNSDTEMLSLSQNAQLYAIFDMTRTGKKRGGGEMGLSTKLKQIFKIQIN